VQHVIVRAVIEKNNQITKGARALLKQILQLSASFLTHMGQVTHVDVVNQAIIERDGGGIGSQDEQNHSQDAGKRSGQHSHRVPSRGIRPLYPESTNTQIQSRPRERYAEK
jgi:hypothetical protein